MPVLIEAEAICHCCKAKARCTVDLDLLVTKRFSAAGGAIRGLPDWFHKEGSGLLTDTQNLACSEKCIAALENKKEGWSTSNHPGEWKRCAG